MSRDVVNSLAAIGERLRAARLTTGLSARTIVGKLQASGLPISHATLCNYELGRTVPEPRIIEALSRLYERPVDWILSQAPVISRVRYRCLKSVRVAERRRYEGEALSWFRAYLAVEDAVDDKESPRTIPFSPGENAEIVAQGVRKDHGFDDYPIPSVCTLLENYGIRVIQIHTDARIDGLAGWIDKHPVVVVTSQLSSDRMRMNLAHELGHHLLSNSLGGKDVEDDIAEAWAFEFASCLLIPDVWLKKAFELKSMVRLVQYKERFGVSLAAMIYRAKKKRLISPSLYERLWRDFARLGWRQNEPGYVQPDRPVRMEALFDAAIHQRKLTLQDIGRLAGVENKLVEERIMQAAGGTTTTDSGETSVISLEAYRHDHD